MDESIRGAKYHKHEKRLALEAARILRRHPGYRSRDDKEQEGQERLVKDMEQHAKNSHELYKLNMKFARHRLVDRYSEDHLSRLTELIWSKNHRALDHKRDMEERAEKAGLGLRRKLALRLAEKRLKKKVGRAPDHIYGREVFPGVGKTRFWGDNKFGRLDNCCVMHAIHHATGIHPRDIVRAFQRMGNRPGARWKEDEGTTDDEKHTVLGILGHSAQEMDVKHPQGHRNNTAGEFAKRWPYHNMIASTPTLLGKNRTPSNHAFNIKDGKVHDSQGIAHEDSPLRHAINIKPYPKPPRRPRPTRRRR